MEQIIRIIRFLLGREDLDIPVVTDEVEGGDPVERLDLSGLTAEDLATIESAGEARFTELRETASTEALSEAADVVDAIEVARTENDARLAAQAQVASDFDALGSRVVAQDEPAGDPAPEGDPAAPDADPVAPGSEPIPDPENPNPQVPPVADPEAPTGDPAGSPVAEPQTVVPSPIANRPQRIAASVRLPMPPSRGQVAPTPRNTAVVLTAGGDMPHRSAGQALEPDALGEAFGEQIESLMAAFEGRRDIPDRKFPCVRARLDQVPPERDLRGLAPEDATARMYRLAEAAAAQPLDAVMASGSMNALMAAATDWCAPFQVDYSLWEDPTSDRRPLADALPGGRWDRGGIRYMSSPALLDFDDTGAGDSGDAVGIRTAAQKDTAKSVMVVDCGDELTAELFAIYKQLEVNNWQNLSYPERTRRFWALINTVAARVAERKVYTLMKAGSDTVTIPASQQGLGAVRDYFAALDLATAGLQYRHRTEGRVYQAVIPTFFRRMLRTDNLRQAPGDQRDRVTDGEIDAMFTSRGIVPVDYLDEPIGATKPGDGDELDNYPANIHTLVYPVGTWFHGTGATLDFGTEIRDSTLIANNKVRAFAETWEGVAKLGPDSLDIQMPLCLSGATSAPVTFDGGCGS